MRYEVNNSLEWIDSRLIGAVMAVVLRVLLAAVALFLSLVLILLILMELEISWRGASSPHNFFWIGVDVIGRAILLVPEDQVLPYEAASIIATALLSAVSISVVAAWLSGYRAFKCSASQLLTALVFILVVDILRIYVLFNFVFARFSVDAWRVSNTFFDEMTLRIEVVVVPLLLLTFFSAALLKIGAFRVLRIQSSPSVVRRKLGVLAEAAFFTAIVTMLFQTGNPVGVFR